MIFHTDGILPRTKIYRVKLSQLETIKTASLARMPRLMQSLPWFLGQRGMWISDADTNRFVPTFFLLLLSSFLPYLFLSLIKNSSTFYYQSDHSAENWLRSQSWENSFPPLTFRTERLGRSSKPRGQGLIKGKDAIDLHCKWVCVADANLGDPISA